MSDSLVGCRPALVTTYTSDPNEMWGKAEEILSDYPEAITATVYPVDEFYVLDVAEFRARSRAEEAEEEAVASQKGQPANWGQ
jgi:hypothetical protein